MRLSGKNRLKAELQTSSGSDQFRRKCAIKTISKRKRTLLFDEMYGRRTVENATNDLFILFRFKAARAVNKDAFRF